jgi:tryptophanyl-tRNA synthetase
MSKSDLSKLACINLIDDPEMIRTKIRKAKTDSMGAITYDAENRPEVSNLLRIYAALEGVSPNKVEQLFEGDNMFAFKEKLSTKLIDKVCPIGEKALELCST